MEPPVSEPNAAAAREADTLAAEPPEEPPGTHSVLNGLRVFAKAEVCVEPPIANSSMLAFPSMTMSCAASFSITVALYGGMKSSSIFEAQVVLMPSVQILSLIAMGMPQSTPAFPASIFFCAAAASARARSAVTVI